MIAGFDHFFLFIWHSLANPVFTFIFKLISIIGEKGIIFFIAAIAMMLFPKTRKAGVCLFGAVACGALITNIILKDLVARPRPFYDEASDYYKWWLAIGSPFEDEFSFPSGHATAAAAGCTALCLTYGKKWLKPSIIWVVLTMIARNYLMAHYPSDVIAGAAIGVASGFIAFYISKFIFDFLEKNRDKKWAAWCLEFSIPAVDKFAYETFPALVEQIKAKLPKFPKLPKISDVIPSKSKAKSKSKVEDIDDEEIEDGYDSDDIEEADEEDISKKAKSKVDIPKIKMPKVPSFKSAGGYVGKHEKK